MGTDRNSLMERWRRLYSGEGTVSSSQLPHYHLRMRANEQAQFVWKTPIWHLNLLLVLFWEHNQAKPEWEAEPLISLVLKNKTGVSLAAAANSRQIEPCREINKLLLSRSGWAKKTQAWLTRAALDLSFEICSSTLPTSCGIPSAVSFLCRQSHGVWVEVTGQDCVKHHQGTRVRVFL